MIRSNICLPQGVCLKFFLPFVVAMPALEYSLESPLHEVMTEGWHWICYQTFVVVEDFAAAVEDSAVAAALADSSQPMIAVLEDVMFLKSAGFDLVTWREHLTMRYCFEERVYYCCSSGAANWVAAVEAAVAVVGADSADAAEEMAFVFVVENSVEGLEMQDC